MLESTKARITSVVATVVAVPVVVWTIWWAWTHWGAIGGIIAIFVVPETIGYFAFMIAGLLTRAALSVFRTKPTAEEGWLSQPEVMSGPITAPALFLAVDIRGPGTLTEYQDGSWLLRLLNGKSLRIDEPTTYFTACRRHESGALTIEGDPFWSIYIEEKASEWWSTSRVISRLPAWQPTDDPEEAEEDDFL